MVGARGIEPLTPTMSRAGALFLGIFHNFP